MVNESQEIDVPGELRAAAAGSTSQGFMWKKELISTGTAEFELPKD